MMKLLVAGAFVLLNFYVYNSLGTGAETPSRQSFSEFPTQLGDWLCAKRIEMAPEIFEALGATDYLICNFRRAETGEFVNLYVGYHETQVREEGGGADENSIHPPEHCLPGSGWDVIDADVVPLNVPGIEGLPGEAKRFIIARGKDRQLVYFWYQSRGRVIARSHEVILYRFWDRATRNRTDGSLVRITIPISSRNPDKAEESFRDFASSFGPLLSDYIPE
jgi:EpsI family protein